MRVVDNPAGLRFLLKDPFGPTGRYIDRKARGVEERAHNKAAGRPGPNIRSGALQAHLRYPGLIPDGDSFVAVITSDAQAPPSRQSFPYPWALEVGVGTAGSPFPLPAHQSRPYRYPFLEPALREEFRA